MTADIEQALAAAEQRAADLDQAAARTDPTAAGSTRERQRAETNVVRAQMARVRAQTEVERFAAAEQRDTAARSRDLAALARDRLATPHEREETATHEQAARDRWSAAADRQSAAEDRAHPRVDREELRSALSDAVSQAQFDDLTGAYRRAMGNVKLHEEIDRARRTDGCLVLAFVDVDELKERNDRDGHAAGDELLLDVVASIQSELRSYDPVVRVGGDEFVCALSGADLGDARCRFDAIQVALAQAHEGASVSVGFSQLRAGDTLDALLARGDAALYAAKQHE